MSRHRFQHLTNRITFPAPRPVAASPALVACPPCFLHVVAPSQQQWMQAIYQEAYERALEAMRPYWLRADRFWAFN